MAKALLLLLVLPLATLGETAARASLNDLVNERLGHMQDVAAYKWVRQLPIEDLDREAVVIAEAKAAGLRYGIRSSATEAFFSEQIEAAKEIQRYWFARWARRGAPETAPDLVTSVRPQLLNLGNDIMASLGDPLADRSLKVGVRGTSRETRERLAAAAAAIDYYPSTFAQVTQNGVLRVGTTGDYAPFSFARDGEPYVGIDIDLAMDLARALGVELMWVKTSWPTLLSDLTEGNFDVAMSGVSRTLARQRDGYFSDAYHTGGKTPIVRCGTENRFNSLAKLDSPGTRAIVNPGGTNHRFAMDRLKNANVVLFRDNRDIFGEIIAGRADVMVTDAIEVSLKSAQHPELCAAMPGKTFTFQEKGYLMQPDEQLREFVNLWLAQRRGDGTLESTFARHLH